VEGFHTKGWTNILIPNFFYSSLVRAKVKGFQTISKKFRISYSQRPTSKFQASIRSKSAPIKTRAEKYNGYDLRRVASQP
jgi:hypothetical protein